MIENQKLSWSGRIYQAYIRSGYRSGKNFISVSDKTRKDLHNLLGFTPSFSKVVLNGLNNDFASPVKLPGDSKPSFFSKQGQHGFILHVGGNQWYKNRVGVVLIYNAWRTLSNRKLPLLLIGPPASGQLVTAKCKSTFEQDIHFINDASDEVVKFAYQHASVFLFPSIAEGFGWPVAEAMSAGCPVITTNEEPMSEVGSDAAFYIPKMPSRVAEVDEWQSSCAEVLETVTSLEQDERDAVKKAGKLNALRFDTSTSMKQIEKYYFELVEPGKLVTEDRQSVQNHVAET
jgi:glycosyltransferase involved in cell wall biosynthesis